MKANKTLIMVLSALMLTGCAEYLLPARAEETKTVPEQLQELIKEFEGDGQYTKKTTICFTEAAMTEMGKYFHANQVDPKRTTYYSEDDEALLMAKPDGTLDASYGGFRSAEDNKVARFHIGDGATLDNMFDEDYEVVDYTYGTGEMSDYYVTLAKLAAADYFDDTWVYSKDYNQYTHDVANATRDEDKYYADFLAFAAPMLTASYSKEYITIKSVCVARRLDANEVPYLSLKLYVDDGDSSKLTGERGSTTMSEARVYEGIKAVGEEDLATAYYLKGTVGGESFKEKMTQDPDNEKQYFVKGLALAKDDLLTVFSTSNGGTWHQEYEHCWSNPVEKGGDFDTDYKVLMTSNSYDVYYKTNEGKSWITANKDTMFFDPNKSAWYKDGAWFAVEYFNKSGAVLNWQKLTEKDGSYFVMNVPTEATQVKFCRMSKDDTTTLDESNAWNKSGKCDLANADVNNAFFLWEDAAWSEWTFSTPNVGSWTNK